MRVFFHQPTFSRKTFFLWALVCISNIFNQCIASQNAPQDLKVQSFSTKDGMSQASVFDIVQDSQGFIWLATQDGLNRFDGSNFVHYRHDSQDVNSLPDNFVRNLFIDSTDVLWVGTEKGLAKYNRQLDKFTNFIYQPDTPEGLLDDFIWDIYQDNNKQLLVSTDLGLHRLDNNTNQFYPLRVRTLDNNASTNIESIKTIFQDSNNNYWLSSYDQGFFIYNEDFSSNNNLLKMIRKTLGISTKQINKIKFLPQNKHYWLATNNGVFVLSADYELVNHYPLKDDSTPAHEDILNAINSTTQNQAQSIRVRTFVESTNNDVWIGSQDGLKSVNLAQEAETNYRFTDVDIKQVNKEIYSAFVDRNETLWVGTYKGLFSASKAANIIKKGKQNSPLLNGNILAILAMDDSIWLTNENQLIEVSFDQNVKKIIKTSGNIEFLAKDTSNIYIIDSNANLTQYELNSGLLKKHSEFLQKTAYRPGPNSIYHHNNRLWFINQKKQLENYYLTQRVNEIISIDDTKFTQLHIGNITNDNNPQLWLTTTENEVMSFNFTTQQFNKVDINFPTNFLAEDLSSINTTKNTLIFSSYSKGVLLSEKIGSSYSNSLFNEKNLLANDFVGSTVVDQTGNIWLSTNKGLSVIDHLTKDITSFYEEHGLSGQEYNEGTGVINKQGQIFFGGNNGLDYFKPKDLLSVTQSIYPPILSKLLIKNKRTPISTIKKPNFTLSAALSELDNIELKFDDWPITIEFVSPNAKMPTQLVYRYQLVGFDNDWIEAEKENLRSTYTNVPAGKYQFKVQVYDMYDPSIIKARSLSIKILAPWWISNSSKLAYSILLLLVLVYFFRQFRQKQKSHLKIRLSEERLKLSLWGSGDEMWDWNVAQCKIYRSNIWGIIDFPQDGTRNQGNSNESNIHQKDIGRIAKALKEHFDGQSAFFEVTYRVRDKDNKWIWVLDRGKVVERDEQNNPTRMAGTLKDITKIKTDDERLQLFANCMESIPDAIVIYDRNFCIFDVNYAYQQITGYQKQQMIGKPITFECYPEKFTSEVKEHLLRKGSWNGEVNHKRASGSIFPSGLSIDVIRDSNDVLTHFVGVFIDMTEQKQTTADLLRISNSDLLTGLPNRTYFQKQHQAYIDIKKPHALLVFDLDNFKKVNDSMGHGAGDALLCKLAQNLRNICQKKEVVYRLSGDEFCMLVEYATNKTEITSIAHSILELIAQPRKFNNHEIVLSGSMGIVIYPENGVNSEEIFKNAETAMHHAKRFGGNKYQFFTSSMHIMAVKRLEIENLIRYGLQEDLFPVFYQPKIEILTGKIIGLEALVRFETPSKGIINPNDFIPTSEETGQILDIGERVLRSACYTIKAWSDEGLFNGRVAVNLSATQFTQPHLVEIINSILMETKLSPQSLELEITEGTMMDSPEQAIATMHEFRTMGIHLSLDDFGTGYSSLAYLKKFPLNTLKIDKAFIDDIEVSEQGRNMVSTIVNIAHNLGLDVVAEGVESSEQLKFLTELGCEQLQGYLYSRPLPEKECRSYLQNHRAKDDSMLVAQSKN